MQRTAHEIELVSDYEIELKESVPGKHKFFTQDMAEGDKVVMYGVMVGTVQEAVQKGARMTVANTKHAADAFRYRESTYQ